MEWIRNGSLERLNAILMTALTSSLGMVPLALAFGAGNEILQPLAIVVLGGLITSTLLTLVVIPALPATQPQLLAKTALPTLAKHLPKSMASLHVVASIQAPLVALALKA